MGRMAIERLCKTHGPGHLAIQPSMHSIWMRCFLASLSDVDPELGPDLEAKWRHALQPGLERLQNCGRGRMLERAAS